MTWISQLAGKSRRSSIQGAPPGPANSWVGMTTDLAAPLSLDTAFTWNGVWAMAAPTSGAAARTRAPARMSRRLKSDLGTKGPPRHMIYQTPRGDVERFFRGLSPSRAGSVAVAMADAGEL